MNSYLLKYSGIIVLVIAVLMVAQAQAITPKLLKQGTATQLFVGGDRMIILGGELGNSSASSATDIDEVFPKLQKMQLNTVLVPASWELIEPIEDKFDFSLIDKIILSARQHELKVVFLWFGAWKNSMSCYTPSWFKTDYNRFPRAMTKSGKPLEIASCFSENVFQADCRAFCQLVRHVNDFDKDETVIMYQVENEIGMLEDARDYSSQANKLFQSSVPSQLIRYLKQNENTLHPRLTEKLSKAGNHFQGNWTEIFGPDIYTDEIFMAWQYASYVGRLSKAARQLTNLPLYVNAAMDSRGRKPGQYPSAGPLAHLIDIWHCAAPDIDFLSPDLYDKGFVDWTAKYKLRNNPLFIPEAKLSPDNGVQALYVLGEHDAIGFCPFSIENGSDNPHDKWVQAIGLLKQLTPIILKNQGTGKMKGLLFDQEHKERTLVFGDTKLSCKHYFTLPWDGRATDGSVWPMGGGITIQLKKDEFLIAGTGIVVEFQTNNQLSGSDNSKLGEDGFVNRVDNNTVQSIEWNGQARIGLLSVEEVSVNKAGGLEYVRRLNGDQTHQGRHVRIGVDDFSVLHVKLYQYQ